DEDPAAVWLDDPDAVGGVDLTVPGSLDHRPHDASFGRPGGGHGALEQVRSGNPGINLAERQPGPRDQPEQPGEYGDAVHRAAEFGHHESAPAVRTEDHIFGCGGLGKAVR